MTTNQERQQMREWAAGLMGWTIICSPDCDQYPLPYVRDQKGNEFSCRPDSPDAPASQILGVIEEMRRRGWAFDLWCHARGGAYCAKFTEDTGVTGNIKRTKENDTSPALAILKAAKATDD